MALLLKPFPRPGENVAKSKCHWPLKKGDVFTSHSGKGVVLEVTTLTDQIIELRHVGTMIYSSGLLDFFNYWAAEAKLKRHEIY